MTIYSEDFFETDWNDIVRGFHEAYTKVWVEDLQTKQTEKIKSLFINTVLRNAPNEARELLCELKELI